MSGLNPWEVVSRSPKEMGLARAWQDGGKGHTEAEKLLLRSGITAGILPTSELLWSCTTRAEYLAVT